MLYEYIGESVPAGFRALHPGLEFRATPLAAFQYQCSKNIAASPATLRKVLPSRGHVGQVLVDSTDSEIKVVLLTEMAPACQGEYFSVVNRAEEVSRLPP
jgi:hypothetical protein